MRNVFLSLGAISSLFGAPEDLPTLTDVQYVPSAVEEFQLPAPAFESPRRSSFVAVGLSTLYPGLGHVYLNDLSMAGGLGGSFGFEYYMAQSPRASDSIQESGLALSQNTWFYGVYAAYRDVRLNNRNEGYSYKMPTETLKDLTLAPFNLSVLKKPEVWGGLLAALGAAVTVSYFGYSKMQIAPQKASSGDLSFLALPIGIGEEAFFRGYAQPLFAERMGPWGGITTSSLLFGAAHIPNAHAFEKKDRWRYYSFSLPLITSMGMYFGYLAEKNGSLKESVAIHTWYDFIIFSLGALAGEAAITGRSQFAISIPI